MKLLDIVDNVVYPRSMTLIYSAASHRLARLSGDSISAFDITSPAHCREYVQHFPLTLIPSPPLVLNSFFPSFAIRSFSSADFLSRFPPFSSSRCPAFCPSIASVLVDRPAERDLRMPFAEMREARLGAITRLPVLGPKVLGLKRVFC
jgi:hypothetical protein